MSGDNLYARFETVFQASATRTAIRSADGLMSLNYGELATGVARYANALAALGVETGDRVTVQVEKSIPNVLLYLAVMKAGGVYQPLNTAYTETEVEYFVGDAEPKVIVCDPSRQTAMRTLGDRHKIFAVVNLDAAGEGSLATLAATMDARHETVARKADDLAGLLYTSGTTGRSKGAMITHGNLASNAARKAQIDWKDLYEVMLNGSGNSGVLRKMVEPALKGDFDGYRFALANAAKDIAYYAELAEDLGCASGLTEAVAEVFAQAVQAGHGGRNVSHLLDPAIDDVT